MNIKEVEKVTGISSQNIRFYEKSGLVHPDRNEENGYREYDTNDIRILKLIKMFRMIDMPIEQIKLILSENHKLPQLLNDRRQGRCWNMKITGFIQPDETPLNLFPRPWNGI